MHTVRSALLIATIVLAGCGRLTGADQQKILDAEAIGYACRVSLKVPEDCMKENEAQSPTSILTGWKEADKDIQGQLIDPTMGKPTASTAAHSAPAAAETENNTATEKTEGKTATEKAGSKTTTGKAAPVATKPGVAETHKAAAH